MTKFEKLLFAILRGTSDKNIRFEDLRQFLIKLEFDERIRGSHHIFRKHGVYEKINIQKEGPEAKAYQVRQVRNILLKYKLGDPK